MKKLVLLTLVTMGLSMPAHASQRVLQQHTSNHGSCGIWYYSDYDKLELTCSDGTLGSCIGVHSTVGGASCQVNGTRRNGNVKGGINGGNNWLMNNLDAPQSSSSSSSADEGIGFFEAIGSLIGLAMLSSAYEYQKAQEKAKAEGHYNK